MNATRLPIVLPPRGGGSAAPLNRAGIRAAREPLLGLVEELRTAEPVSARGVALVERLLTDGGSPAYGPAGERALEQQARQARAELSLA